VIVTKNPSTERDRRGVWLALTAAALFGVSAPAAKALLQGASPQLLAGLLYAGSGAGLAVVFFVRARRDQNAEARLTRRDAPWLVGAILFGGIVGPVLLLIGLSHSPDAPRLRIARGT
jgi:drug/metabolite transporter (DMT)-like permease